MSQQQRDALDQLLRDGPLDLGGDVAQQRVIFKHVLGGAPTALLGARRHAMAEGHGPATLQSPGNESG